jgi:hypothetical protein
MIVSWLGGPQYTTYGFKVQRNAIIQNGVVLAGDQIIKRIRKDIKARLYLKRKFKKFGLNSIMCCNWGSQFGIFWSVGIHGILFLCSYLLFGVSAVGAFQGHGKFPCWLNLSLVVCCWLFFVCGLFTLDLCISFVSE